MMIESPLHLLLHIYLFIFMHTQPNSRTNNHHDNTPFHACKFTFPLYLTSSLFIHSFIYSFIISFIYLYIPGDGFLPIGSNEDSLGTVFGMPKPKKDLKKLQRNHGRMIRCKTVLLSDDEIDSSREFLLTFYLEDDTIAMYEDVGRNSGIWGGNYLKRGRYLNTLPHGYEGLNDPYKDNTPRYIIAQDIYFGNILAFNGKEFQIIEMDSMSLQYCENSPQDFPFMDTFQIIGNLLNVVTNRKLDLRPAFRSRDVTKVGYFDFNTFIEALDAFQLTKGLNDQQTLTLMRRFKDDDDKYIYDELCDILSHVYAKQHATMSGSSSTFIGEAAYGSRQVRKKIALNVSSFKHFLEASRVRTIPWRRYVTYSSDTLLHLLFALSQSPSIHLLRIHSSTTLFPSLSIYLPYSLSITHHVLTERSV